jgi:hypothetical protein
LPARATAEESNNLLQRAGSTRRDAIGIAERGQSALRSFPARHSRDAKPMALARLARVLTPSLAAAAFELTTEPLRWRTGILQRH